MMYTSRSNYNLAPPWMRIAAGLVDVMFLSMLYVALNNYVPDIISNDGLQTIYAGNILFLILVPIYFILTPLLFNGRTVGKGLFGLRIIRINGAPIKPSDSVARTLGYYVSSMLFYLGFLGLFTNELRQGWHDQVAGTTVIMGD